MYEEWGAALAEADSRSDVTLAAVTGAGDFYCSGNDLNNFMGVDPSNMEKMARDSAVLLENFVKAFIDFSKPLVGVVNGPAVGVSVTTLGLFDIVYSTDKVSFLPTAINITASCEAESINALPSNTIIIT